MWKMAENWNDLAEPILLHIFRHLNINDRKNASLTCKNWSRILNSASLWRSVFCQFYSEPVYDEPFEKGCKLTKCLPLVRYCAAWIQELTIKFYEGSDDDEENLEIMKTFTNSLVDSEDCIQLRKFSFDMDYRSIYDEIVQEIIISLAKFLRRQNGLVSFHANWNLPAMHCAVIIDALTGNSRTTLKVLEIIHYFPGRLQEIYQSSLRALKQLQYLTLPYETLGRHSMRAIASNCPFLTLLTLSIETELGINLRDNPVVSEDLWKEVLEKIPELKVAVQIGIFAANSSDLKIILPPTIPLVGVRSLQRPLHPKTIIHLHQFKSHLRSLELMCIGYKYFTIDLINSCRNLTMLKLMTQLSKDTVDILVDLNIKELRGLNRVSFFLQLQEELKERELPIKEIYRSMWSSNHYYMEIFTNPQADIYKYTYDQNFCLQLYPAI